MATRRGLTRRLGRELILQGLYISIAALVGVFAVSALIENVLIKQALRGEADYYWQRYAGDRDAALPNTRNMTGYRRDIGGGVPIELQQLPPGFHAQESPEAIAFISERDGETLYLVFDSGQVGSLILLFGLLPLAVVLIVVYLSLFSAYRVSSRAVSPVIRLADKVQQLDPADPDAALFNDHADRSGADDEVAVLARAMQDMTQRVIAFTERERNFTRDASHELRSPLTVIKMAAGNLRQHGNLDRAGQKNLARIAKSADDMEALTEAFLLLARESGDEMIGEPVSVNEVVDEIVERLSLLAREKAVTVSASANCELTVSAPGTVIASVIGNLLRNGLSYTDEGSVTATIDNQQVRIEDTGSGMSAADVEKVFQPFFRAGRRRGGHGVGLTIVKRLCDRFGWDVDIESELDVGTRVTVSFPNGVCQPSPSRDLHTT